VHQFLRSISATQYQQYQDNIHNFLASPKAMEFDTTSYVSIIVNKILSDLQR
jgi:hypothetical protein